MRPLMGSLSPQSRILRPALFLIGLSLFGCMLTDDASPPPSGEAVEEPIVAAAASLRRVLPPILEAYQSSAEAPTIRITYGASGLLRRQVEAGAPIDAVVFAADWLVDSLIRDGLVDGSSRRLVAENELVLVGRHRQGGGGQSSAPSLRFRDLAELRDSDKLAIGDPSIVPAGRHARDVLEQLEIWASVQDHLVYGGDVTRVLTYARRDEVDAAVVYATDARGVDDVEVLDHADWSGAPRPRIVAGVTRLGTDNQLVNGFVSFLSSPPAREIFETHGFRVP